MTARNPQPPSRPRSDAPATGTLCRAVRVGVFRWGLILICLLCLRTSAFALLITNVSTVNVTPTSFSVVWATSPTLTPLVSVYADPGGVTNLAGQLGIEYYPLHTGDPAATNSYQRRLSQASLRQKSSSLGLVQVRVSGCAPNTTYYYSVQVTNGSGQSTTWPASGPLPAVTTAQENSFVLQSRQLVISLAGADPSGTVVLLSNTNTPSVLAAVAGDGVASNEVFFSVSDLIDTLGKSNYLELGNQQFTASVLGTTTNGVVQTYSLAFTPDFLVAQIGQFSAGEYFAVSIGSTVVRSGTSGVLPIGLNSTGLRTLSFILNVPGSRFSSMFLQGLSPQLGSLALQPLNPNSLLLNFTAASGQLLQGNQPLAQLTFNAAAGQSSAFVPFAPQSFQAQRGDGSAVVNIVSQPGRVVIVGNEPLLESSIGPGPSRNLALYGIPWSSYKIQYSTDLSNPAGWTDLTAVAMTNLMQMIYGLDPSKNIVFYRAYEFTSLQPILERGPGNELVLFGMPWSAYELDYATSLNFPITWNLGYRVPLTNSFQFLSGISSSSPFIFYRGRILNTDPPSLDASLVNQKRSLMVYGRPGTNYVLQYSTNLSGVVTWYPLLNYTLTNSFQSVTNLGNTNPAIFYRVKR